MAMEELLKKCLLCPRRCGADRINGEKGICGAGERLKVARAALHYWEEPCISGERGSGTVFFSYCPLHCVYCQNAQISRGQAGAEITVERLAEIFLELEAQGAHNINLVTPTHYTPQIVCALHMARERGLHVPIVHNGSGYEAVETLRMQRGLIDIYLTDFKYMDRQSAQKYSHAGDYIDVAKAALAEMVRQKGGAVFDGQGIMQQGVIVRYLLLPGHTSEGKDVIRYLYETYGDQIYISLMSQYTPVRMDELPEELQTGVRENEYAELVKYALALGVENGFLQESGAAEESFVPPFDLTGVFRE